jgi:hypothetical protein
VQQQPFSAFSEAFVMSLIWLTLTASRITQQRMRPYVTYALTWAVALGDLSQHNAKVHFWAL